MAGQTATRTATAPRTADIFEAEVAPAMGLEAQTRGEVDVQIATAKRYPRSVAEFMKQAETLATLNEDVAGSCFYAVPRDGRTVEGPSARLAEICASCWGHMRIQARIVDEDERFITARGESWDLQNNVAIGYEVRRRITGRNGHKFSDDMVGVTGNAASSIALRNAVFKNIPSAFWRPIYEKCRQVAVGNAQTLANRRAKMLAHFQQMGVTAERVLAVLAVKGVEDITLAHMATLHGLATAIKDGDTTVDEAFPAVVAMPQRQSDPQPTKPVEVPTPQENRAAVMEVGRQAATPPSPAGVALASVEKKTATNGSPYWNVATHTGEKAYTWSKTVGAQLEEAKMAGTPVRLTTEKDAKGYTKITAIEVLQPREVGQA